MRRVGGDAQSSESCPFENGVGNAFFRNNNIIDIAEDKNAYFI